MIKIVNREQKLQNERVKLIISGLDYDRLTEWEEEFVESVEMQSDEGKILSEKQMEILEKIYRRKAR